MRELALEEMESVSGGFGFFMEFIKWGAGELASLGIERAYGRAGVAGAGGSEMDNGGTSYGIDRCNTFGC